MDKNKFLTLIANPVEITENDMDLFSSILEAYPYCQIAHLILAKLKYDANSPDKTEKLNQAALYTTNRSLLKKIIEAPWDQAPQPPREAGTDENAEHIPAEDTASSSDPGSRDEAIVEQEAPEPESPDVKEKPALDEGLILPETQMMGEESLLEENEPDEAVSEPGSPATEDGSPGEETSGNTEDLANQVLANLEEAKKLKERIDVLQADDVLASEIQNAEESPDPDNADNNEEEPPESGEELTEKKQQQLQIIDNFINNEYLLTNRRYRYREETPEEKQEDLSVKSSSLGEDLVSENLALILVKQNKIDKAIDIYKKLIWKFPQKKAYFASLIEELKNK